MKHTEINDIALELNPDLCLSSQERGPVRGIPCATFDIDRDGCSILNVAYVVVEINVGPGILDFIVEGLEISDSLVLAFQVVFLLADCFRILRVLPLLRLQIDDLSGIKVSKNAVAIDDLLDLVEALLESMHSTNSNVVDCTTSVLILNGGVLTKDVAIADPINLVTRVIVFVFVFVKPEGESALSILHLKRPNSLKSWLLG